jgi:hypothetical protein
MKVTPPVISTPGGGPQTGPLQDPADRRTADPVPEMFQLAADPLIPPRVRPNVPLTGVSVRVTNRKAS